MQAFWFGVIAVLWAMFFVLEGFDFGVGVLFPFITRSEQDRKILLRTIGPVWDGNEVWLVTAGGAMFAAFPDWYAGVFSGFYLAFALLVVGLILRGIGIEYRGKADTAMGRRWCDIAFVSGSVLPALLLGVAFANFLRGVRVNSEHVVTSSFFSLLSPYALLGGVVTLGLFAFHGAVYLCLRSEGDTRDRARRSAAAIGPITGVAATAFVILTAQIRGGYVSWLLGVALISSFVVAALAAVQRRDGTAFAASALATLLVPLWAFACLWPDVLPARNNKAFSLTVYNASSSPYTLKVMTVVALLMTPIVLAYQAWSYWVFRARVTGADVVGDGYGGRVARTVASAHKSAVETLGTTHVHDDGTSPRAPSPL